MVRYDFKCDACGEVRTETTTEVAGTPHLCNEDGRLSVGAWKRVWSAPLIHWPTRNRGH